VDTNSTPKRVLCPPIFFFHSNNAFGQCTLSSMIDLTETLVKWEPIEGISFDFISADVFSRHLDVWVRLVDGRVDVPEHHDLIFQFSRVAGFAVHEEFAHPAQGTVWGREPVISPECRATFPCLIVTGSQWFKSIGAEIEINYQGAKQYRLCTNFPVVDVISSAAPTVRWHVRSKSAQEVPGPPWLGHDPVRAGERSQMS